jgi:hypothetical protein
MGHCRLLAGVAAMLCLAGWSEGMASEGPFVLGHGYWHVNGERWSRGIHGTQRVVPYSHRWTLTFQTTVENASVRSLIFLGARTVTRADSLLRLVDVRVESIPPCDIGGSEGLCPEWVRRVPPLRIAPAKSVVLTLTYQFVRCPAAVRASTRSPRQLVVQYREHDQSARHATLSIVTTGPLLQRPKPDDCPL